MTGGNDEHISSVQEEQDSGQVRVHCPVVLHSKLLSTSTADTDPLRAYSDEAADPGQSYVTKTERIVLPRDEDVVVNSVECRG